MRALPCLLLLLCTSSSLAFLLAPPSASSPHVCPSFPYCFQDSRTGQWAPLSLHHLLAPTYQSSPMMHKSVAYRALTVAAPSTRESSPCWLPDTYCTARPSNTLATREVDTAALCQEECAKKEGCTYFTFTKRRGKSSCSLLSECTISARCEVGPNCASGRPTCSCPQIKKGGEEEAEEDTETRYARWSCGSVDPYTSEVPTGTVCKTTCPAWRNQGLESTCQPDGQWSSTAPTATASSSRLAPFILPYFDFVIAKPDQPDMVCGCQDVGPFDYDPTAEEGAEMVCRDSDPPQFSSDQGWKFTTTNYCTLFCNKEPVVDVYCQGSRWQGEPERGLWCYTQPENPAPGKIAGSTTPAPTPAPTPSPVAELPRF